MHDDGTFPDGVEDDEPAQQARSGLRLLARRTPVPAGWHPADVVQARLRRRRMRRALGTGLVLAALYGAGAVALTSGPDGDRHAAALPGPAQRSALPGRGEHVGGRLGAAVQLVADTAAAPRDAAAARQAADASSALALQLLRHAGGDGTVSVSPTSLQLALGMLRTGARGATEQQIAAALQSAGVGVEQQDAGLATLTRDLGAAAAAEGITLASADSIWQQRGFPVRPAYLAALARYYRAGVWQADFTGHPADAVRAIDAWTAQQTRGRIRTLFDSLDRSTVLVLANAIFFRAAWATPFEPAATWPGPFRRADGSSVTAQYLSGGRGLRTAATADYQAVQLPYRGGRFAALAIMPRRGTVAGLLRTLTPAGLSAIAGGVRATGTAVRLPRFTTTSTLDLVPTLTALGIRDAFSPAADLSGLSPVATQVGQVLQRVYLSVGEQGTTAAAVTGVAINAMAGTAGPVLSFDHPFLFLVRDTVTGAVLFASTIADPTA